MSSRFSAPAPAVFPPPRAPTRVSVPRRYTCNLRTKLPSLSSRRSPSCLPLAAGAVAARPDLGPSRSVTANRAPSAASDETLAAVTVLTREDIERSQAPDLLDAARRARPASTSPAPAAPARPARCSCAAATPTTRWCWWTACASIRRPRASLDFAHLPLAQIERIEIVRGPRAALWGSDAIGGVIQMFTRDPSKAFVDGARRQLRTGRRQRRRRPRARRQRGSASALGGERCEGFSATNEAVAFGFDPDRTATATATCAARRHAGRHAAPVG